jgi:hypothetical protein
LAKARSSTASACNKNLLADERSALLSAGLKFFFVRPPTSPAAGILAQKNQ